MVKKRISGQTIAIIILAILLFLAICFGAVYAYYTSSTNKVSGKIVMAVLNINFQDGFMLESDQSASSEVLVSNGVYSPGDSLKNTALVINNASNTDVFIAVVYKVNTSRPVADYDDTKPLIDVGITEDSDWTDYLFVSKEGVVRSRCLILKQSQTAVKDPENPQTITVIGSNCLRIPEDWGNGFQDMEISFSFQAFAVSASAVMQAVTEDTLDNRCAEIMNQVYTDNAKLSIWTRVY